MNLLRKIYGLCTAMLCLVLIAGCSDDDVISSNGTAGYLKLMVAPQTSTATRAGGLSLSNVRKVEVSMLYGDLPVTQSLNLSSAEGAAELGLESEKLELRAGEYKMQSYILYGTAKPGAETPEMLMTVYLDEVVPFSISNGHVTEVNLQVKSSVYGKVYFDILKDLSNYKEETDKANQGVTRAFDQDPELFSYDDIAEVDLYYKKKGSSERVDYHSFKVYTKKGEKYLHTDTVSTWEAGEYEITRYMLYSDKRTNMLLAGDLKDTYVNVAPVMYTQASFTVTYPENMRSIKDYLALYNIWINMDGPNWKYQGESFPAGANWRFADRPIDEWGNQPGVELSNTGGVKTLDIGSFNPEGAVPDALGDLTELEALWLGTHNDAASIENTEDMYYVLNTYELRRRGIDICARRMEIAKERSAILHSTSTSRIYTTKKPERVTFATRKTYDFAQGSLSNRITSIPETIGNLKQLTYLYVANGRVSDLPTALKDLPALTDLEFYNCQFKTFPDVLTKMTSVVSLNFSCNATMEADELYNGLNAFVKSNNKVLQILYVTSCKLEKFPEELANATKIGLIDFTSNRLKKLDGTKRRLAPVQAFFDHNQIEVIADDFCETDDIEKFSISNNCLTEFPNLFKDGTKSKYTASSVDFSDNHITHFKEGFLGIRAETLTLSKNPLGEGYKTGSGKKLRRMMPKELSETKSQISHLVLQNCEIDSLPPESFKNLDILEALDLSGNRLRYLPKEFDTRTMAYVSGLNLSYNCFSVFPLQAFTLPLLNKLYLTDQSDIVEDNRGNKKEIRCLKNWPTGLSTYPAYATLRLLDISYNDIQKIEEYSYPTLVTAFNVSENPNIEMTIPSDVCSKIGSGLYTLGFDSNQTIWGCSILDLDINK